LPQNYWKVLRQVIDAVISEESARPFIRRPLTWRDLLPLRGLLEKQNCGTCAHVREDFCRDQDLLEAFIVEVASNPQQIEGFFGLEALLPLCEYLPSVCKPDELLEGSDCYPIWDVELLDP